MFKNFVLLMVLTWVTLSHAKVVHENLADTENYMIEKAAPEQDGGRTLAGGKIKKKKKQKTELKSPAESLSPETMEQDPDLHYWKYSDE
jgi:hypothetical protein